MLFLDDDIRRLNVAKLSSAGALLDDYPVVGFKYGNPGRVCRGARAAPDRAWTGAIRFWRLAPDQPV